MAVRDRGHFENAWVARDFVDAWTAALQPKHVVQVGDAEWAVLTEPEARIDTPAGSHDLDLVLAEPSWRQGRSPIAVGGRELRLPDYWVDLVPWFRALASSGYAFAVLPSIAIDIARTAGLFEELASETVGINAVLRLPGGLFGLSSGFRPCLVVFDRFPKDTLFVGDLGPQTDTDGLVERILGHTDGGSLDAGTVVPRSSFRSVEGIEFHQRAQQLAAQFPDYTRRTLKDLSLNTHRVRRGEQHEPRPNAVYISQMESAKRRVVTDPAEISGGHEHYLCVELDRTALPGFVAFYLQTEMGESLIRALATGASIKRVRVDDLLTLEFALPPIEIQQTIVEAERTLRELTEAVGLLRADLDAKPDAARELLTRGQDMLQVIDRLSDDDLVRRCLRTGESQTVEFKETFTLCTREGKRADYVEHAVVKTIAAFLNTRGGSLLVGVDDGGQVLGLERELDTVWNKKGYDGLLLHLDNVLKREFGDAVNAEVERDFVDFEGNRLLLVKCPRSAEPVFTKNEQFYVRKSPATGELKGRDLAQYIQKHFREGDPA
jgi:hypothetical protein